MKNELMKKREIGTVNPNPTLFRSRSDDEAVSPSLLTPDCAHFVGLELTLSFRFHVLSFL
jgi:hypothetical protein